MSAEFLPGFNNLSPQEKEAINQVLQRNDKVLDNEIKRVKAVNEKIDKNLHKQKESAKSARITNKNSCYICPNVIRNFSTVKNPAGREGECGVCKRSACDDCSNNYDDPFLRICVICDNSFQIHAKSGGWFLSKIDKKLKTRQNKQPNANERQNYEKLVKDISGMERINAVCSDNFLQMNSGAWASMGTKLNSAVNVVRNVKTNATIRKNEQTADEWSDILETIEAEHSAPPQSPLEKSLEYQKNVLSLTKILRQVEEALNSGRVTEEIISRKEASSVNLGFGEDDDDNPLEVSGLDQAKNTGITIKEYRNFLKRLATFMQNYNKLYEKKELKTRR